MIYQSGPSTSIDAITQLTELLAAHGVYALTVIFIFYQQRAAHNALKNAAPNDHNFFKKVYASVVVATYVLMAASTGIWFYGNYLYGQRAYIKGSVMGLMEHRTPPS